MVRSQLIGNQVTIYIFFSNGLFHPHVIQIIIIWQARVLANCAIWLAADGVGFEDLPAIFIALKGKQSHKTLKFNEIVIIKVKSVKMRDEKHS